MEGKRSLLVKAVLGLVITSALVWVLLRYIKLEQLWGLLAQTHWTFYVGTMALWIVVYLIRTMRFVLVAPRTPYFTMLCITSVHNFLTRLFPLRTGELSFGFLLKRAGTAGLGESLLGLLLLRVVDATCVVAVFTVALAFHPGVYLGQRSLGIAVAVAAVAVGIVVVFSIEKLLRLTLRVTRASLNVVGLGNRPGVVRALSKIADSVEAIAGIGIADRLKITAISVVQWLLTFGSFFVIMQGFSIDVGIAQTVLGSTASIVTGFLPIGGIGSFGTLEAGWALGFVLVGLDRETAVASGFGISITTFSFAAVLGLLGWIGLWFIGRRKALES